MKELWRRWRQLWGESRIRLEAPELQVDRIQAGDRLQAGPRLWRVERRLALVMELAEVDAAPGSGARRANLYFDRSDPELPWVLQEDAGAVRLAARDLTHFPVSLFG